MGCMHTIYTEQALLLPILGRPVCRFGGSRPLDDLNSCRQGHVRSVRQPL